MFIDTEKPLVSKILIDGKAQRVEYEDLPLVCFGCERFEHAREFCTHINRQDDLAGNRDIEKGKEGRASRDNSCEDLFGS